MTSAQFNKDKVIQACKDLEKTFQAKLDHLNQELSKAKKLEEAQKELEIRSIMKPKWYRPWPLSRSKALSILWHKNRWSSSHSHQSNLVRYAIESAELKLEDIKPILKLAQEADSDTITLSTEDANFIFPNLIKKS